MTSKNLRRNASIINARLFRFAWLLNPVNMFHGWCAYDVRGLNNQILLICAIKRNGNEDELKYFWETPEKKSD